MDTLISSPTQTVRIGPGLPFVIIGERINPTGRKQLAAEMAAGNFERVEADALAQVAAGAQVLDVNAGIPLADEPAILAETVRRVQAVTDVPLSLDSSVVAALEAGLAAYQGKALVNSVTGEEDRMATILPLVKQHNAAVIGLCNDETGISEDPDVRFAIAERIVERAADYGISQEDVIIDPLVMPIGAVQTAGAAVFKLVQRLRQELMVNTVCGASNVSFGLPGRPMLNAAFISMAIAAGMTSAITNPLEDEVRRAILAADALMGRDDNLERWIMTNRGGEGRASRRAARRARRQREPVAP